MQINCFDPGQAYTSLTDEIIQAGEKLEPKVVSDALETRTTGGTSPDQQMKVAEFLASEASNHVTGKADSRRRRLEEAEERDAETGCLYLAPASQITPEAPPRNAGAENLVRYLEARKSKLLRRRCFGRAADPSMTNTVEGQHDKTIVSGGFGGYAAVHVCRCSAFCRPGRWRRYARNRQPECLEI